MNNRSMLLLAFLLLGLFSGAAHAHKVNMFAFAEGDQVFVEGYFSDGKRAKNSKVVVYDPDGNVLLEGLTDEEGAYTFDIPRRVDLRITLNAGMGHKTEYVIASDELSGGIGALSAETDSTSITSPADDAAATPAPVATVASSALGRAELKKAVGEAIRPLMRSISELEERRSFSDIVGGLGFIVGIAGVYFYVKARGMLQKTGRNRQD
ncbi:MAG TPA: hypothetical protein ENJ22_05905 [Gammaproteobacteria bacterium]|nr:hypothetical protein [Gammaproteobacteria bacterium]